MEPFEKHQAELGVLRGAASDLLSRASQAGDTMALTTQRYQPVPGNWGGIGAAEAQRAPQPLQSNASGAGKALAWAAVVAAFWAGKVEAFNAEVDRIVARFNGLGPNYGLTGDPSDGEIEQARAEALAGARGEWWRAYNTYILDGEDEAASMLADGPPGAISDLWRKITNAFGEEVRPPTGDWTSFWIWLAGRTSLFGASLGTALSWADRNNARMYKEAHEYSRRLRLGRRHLMHLLESQNAALRGAGFWQRVSKLVGIAGPLAAGGLAGWNQWRRDQEYSTGERAGRTAVRGALVGGGAAAGEAIGGRFGGPVGAWAGGVVGGAVADWGATEAVRGYSSVHHGVQERDPRAIADGALSFANPIGRRVVDAAADWMIGKERAEAAQNWWFGPNRAKE
jgi:hypothetical protein